MTKPRRPPLVRLCELQVGQMADFYAQLAEKRKGNTQGGKPYYQLRFRDARRTAAVMVWSDSDMFEPCTHWQAGQFFKIRGIYREHERFGPQLDIEAIRPVEDRDREDGFSECDFVTASRYDPEQMFQELVAWVDAEIKDIPLRQLVGKLLTDHQAALKGLPATDRKFYPFPGGWLEHVLHVARHSVWIADRYMELFPDLSPPLNRDLVAAAAVLHDIGRVRELDPIPGQPTRTTVAGELFGHIFLAYDMIRDAAREIPDLNPELVQLLLHIVASHLRLPEWGSPRLPCIPEVLIIHHLDDLDAKFEMFARCLTNDAGEGPFTERDPILSRPLLKQRSV